MNADAEMISAAARRARVIVTDTTTGDSWAGALLSWRPRRNRPDIHGNRPRAYTARAPVDGGNPHTYPLTRYTVEVVE